MASQIILQEARRALDEPGFGELFDFGRLDPGRVQDLFRDGVLTAARPESAEGAGDALAHSLMHDPIAGHLCGLPSRVHDSASADDWLIEPAAAFVDGGAPFYDANGAYTLRGLHTDTGGAWSLTDAEPAAWGQGRYLRFHPYSATGEVLTLRFGGVWRLLLLATGEAELAELVPTVVEDPEDPEGEERIVEVPVTRAVFDWLAHEWEGRWHWLWIYEVRGKLIVRNLEPSPDGEQLGICYLDPGAPEEPAPEPEPEEGEGEPGAPLDPRPPHAPVPGMDEEPAERPRHALRGAPWRLEGSGPLTVTLVNQTWVPGTSRLARVAPARLAFGSTQAAAARVYGLGTTDDVVPRVTITDADGGEWPQAGGPYGARDAMGFTLEWDSTAERTFFLNALQVGVPATARLVGGPGTDLLALPGVHDERIELTREGDLTRERLAATVGAFRTPLPAWCQPHLLLRYVVDGVTRFRGFTDEAEWHDVTDTVPQTGKLTLQAQGLWSRFRRCHWGGGEPFDGRPLVACIAELLARAGLTAADYELAPWPYVLPSAPEGEPPALVYRPEETVDRILEDLRSKFYGSALAHYFRPSDGKFVLAALGAGASVAPFFDATAAAAAAGYPWQVILDGTYAERLDESELANYVAVIGMDAAGQPLLARAIDWASIRTTAPPNGVGEVWPLVVVDPGLATQAAVNYVCRRLFERHRLPIVHVEWQSIRVDVHPGECVTLHGPNHGLGEVVQLDAVALAQSGTGDAADPQGRATYRGVKVA